jgi:hypothetical protein
VLANQYDPNIAAFTQIANIANMQRAWHAGFHTDAGTYPHYP